MRKYFSAFCSLLMFLTSTGCESPELSGIRAAQLAQSNRIGQEPAGDYFIGRRYYNANYKFWGYIRKLGQPWRDGATRDVQREPESSPRIAR